MRGRKPKPTHLKVLDGNAGHRPIDQDAVVPAHTIPDPPAFLAGEALAEYERIAEELFELGLVGEIDRNQIAAYAVVYARWAEAERQIEKHGWLIKSPNGYPLHSPYLAIANKALEQMRAWAIEYGLTPSARSRIRGSAQLSLPFGEDGDEFERFIARGSTGNGRTG